mmetsp:Transcript_13092/g.19735  ORF Transcript_13092/g.19735 Transcript_13092/m.19735 type:complete len:227 (-) Transcript_13092:90-770(-)
MMVPTSNIVGFVLFCFTPALQQTVAFSTTNDVAQSTNSQLRNTVQLMASSTPTADADLLPEIRDEIIEREGQLEMWEESTQIISDLFGSSDEEAELYLADAFRWKAWASASDMMRKYQRPVLPDAGKIQEGLNWLKEGPLEMNDDQIRSCIQQYPGIYLREPNAMYRKVMGSAPRKYRDDTVLKQFIEDDPNILQVTFNCGDEGCQSECGSCWVAYENRLPSIPDF